MLMRSRAHPRECPSTQILGPSRRSSKRSRDGVERVAEKPQSRRRIGAVGPFEPVRDVNPHSWAMPRPAVAGKVCAARGSRQVRASGMPPRFSMAVVLHPAFSIRRGVLAEQLER
jgi:hypothetical protein